MEFKGSWDRYVHLMESFYKNSYHASIGMATYEALYERRCRTPLYWTEVGEGQLKGQCNMLQIKFK